jgi:hypothetical protein
MPHERWPVRCEHKPDEIVHSEDNEHQDVDNVEEDPVAIWESMFGEFEEQQRETSNGDNQQRATAPFLPYLVAGSPVVGHCRSVAHGRRLRPRAREIGLSAMRRSWRPPTLAVLQPSRREHRTRVDCATTCCRASARVRRQATLRFCHSERAAAATPRRRTSWRPAAASRGHGRGPWSARCAPGR